jgi:acetoacetyl-CoA synthetase
VWAGEIQVPALGMDVDVFDADGHPTREAGDLVCKSPFPSMPVAFWNDPDGAKYPGGVLRKVSERLVPRRLDSPHRRTRDS